MTQHSLWRGLGVALVTPFSSDNSIDYTALERLVEHVIDGGVDFLVVLGSTGESNLLSDQEKREVLDFVIKTNAKRKPLMAGCFGMNNTKALVEFTQAFDFTGIDGVLSSSPEYVKPSQAGIMEHYKAFANVCPVPIMVYNVPGRTVSNMTWETSCAISGLGPKFVGIKEATGNLIQSSHIVYNKKRADFVVTSGDDETALPMMATGGDGVISVIANIFPREMKKMVDAALRHDMPTAIQANAELYPMHNPLYIEGNPTGIKTALKHIGIGNGLVRLPLLPLTEANANILQQTIDKINA